MPKCKPDDAGCGAESPDGYYCTEAAFHDGMHQATDTDGEVYCRWKQGESDFGLTHLIVLAEASGREDGFDELFDDEVL